MAIGFAIRADLHHVELALASVKNGVPRAANRAINRTLTTVRADAARRVAADIGGLPINEVRKALVVTKSRFSTLRGVITITGRRIPLIKLRPSPSEPPSRGKGQGVSYVGAGGGRVRIPDAFIVRLRSGHVGVFKRRPPSVRKSAGAWSKNLPLTKELEGPSIPRVAAKRSILTALKTLGQTTLARNLQSEIRFLLGTRRVPAGDD